MTKTNTDVKDYLKRAEKIENDLDELRQEKKDLNAEMKASGVNLKVFSVVLKQIRKPADEELKTLANLYLESAGQYQLFA